MTSEVVGTRYRHYKGNRYQIIADARHSETHEPLIVYRDLSDESKVWARPREMFFEDVIIDGVQQKRFTPLGSDSDE